MLSKSIILAAHGGLLVGALAGCATHPPAESPADAAATSKEDTRKATETPTPATPVDGAAEGKSCCKGMNECKGKGGCRAGLHSCAGKNECKGQGGCNGHCPK